MALRCALWIPVAALAAGCSTHSASEIADRDDDFAADGMECMTSADCVAAGASCCECATFALPVTRGWEQSCGEVNCVDPDYAEECPSTEAACELGECALRCTPVECALDCGIFDTDDFGCLLCSCGSTVPPADAMCDMDDYCVRAPADCCGCEHGGVDTAVPAVDLAAFEAELGCDPSPVCPGVNTCDPELTPRCVGGVCALAAAPGPGRTSDAGPNDFPTDPAYCGGGHGPCPPGEMCVLNDPGADEASSMGVGVCQIP